jgi:hypothetical protein
MRSGTAFATQSKIRFELGARVRVCVCVCVWASGKRWMRWMITTRLHTHMVWGCGGDGGLRVLMWGGTRRLRSHLHYL